MTPSSLLERLKKEQEAVKNLFKKAEDSDRDEHPGHPQGKKKKKKLLTVEEKIKNVRPS